MIVVRNKFLAAIKVLAWLLMLDAVLLSGIAQAGVVISGTRVIYAAQEREVTVKLDNEGTVPALVQVWLDTGNPNAMPDETPVPFTLSPPLFRLDPKKGQSLRLIYTQEPLPQDKESLYWLNVLEVPPRATATPDDPNSLQLAFRSRIKLFFRPTGLKGDPRDAPAQVTWSIVPGKNGNELKAENPGAYHITFSAIDVVVGGVTYHDDKGGMVDPQSSMSFALHGLPASSAAPLKVVYHYIDDYGAALDGTFSLNAR